ncbi:hypothetical protein TSUD_137240 [Trifolium subterraneum]|uniref:Uncharacterized protein n=1 Tax=Trifolium subterraneum TaxID=3900 RepID=A0A2Z6P1X3_TRISU|nr:hypothetical protein TSUD_137240 [Trifolium subterraneum]
MNSMRSNDSDQAASPTSSRETIPPETIVGAVWASRTEQPASLREESPATPFWRGLRTRRGELLSRTTSFPRLHQH